MVEIIEDSLPKWYLDCYFWQRIFEMQMNSTESIEMTLAEALKKYSLNLQELLVKFTTVTDRERILLVI